MQRFHFLITLLWSLINFGDNFSHGSTLSRHNATVTIAILGRSDPEISSTVSIQY